MFDYKLKGLSGFAFGSTTRCCFHKSLLAAGFLSGAQVTWLVLGILQIFETAGEFPDKRLFNAADRLYTVVLYLKQIVVW